MDTCYWCGKPEVFWHDEKNKCVCEDCWHDLYAYCDTCGRRVLKTELTGSPWSEIRCNACWDWFDGRWGEEG